MDEDDDSYDWELPEPDEDEDGPDTEPCPECGETIHAEAEQCPYCGAYVTRSTSVLEARPWWFVLMAVLGILAVIFASIVAY